MATSEYELWDIKTANMLFYATEREKMVEMLQLLFEENRLSPHLDDLGLLVYSAEDTTKTYDGVEAIEKWLTDNE